MALRARKHVRRFALHLILLCVPLLYGSILHAQGGTGRFDLTGPKIDVRVTRGGDSLPIAAVPNLQAGDRIWLHPDLPPTQSVKYLLICVFLRGTTNPPPDNWFVRIETWDKKVRSEGVFVTVPDEAQQVVLLLAPETGGDFTTLKSAVTGRPGVFVRAQQDLVEAGFEQARIEKYLASIRRVPPSDPDSLQRHSDLLARTLNLKPNPECFKRPVDTQFTCLTQTGTQSLLDDGHGQSIVAALSNGPGSDFINQASYTQAAGAGLYSAYVGAVVDLVRILSNLHVAQFQYIPAIAFPQAEALNLRLNTPPSFHNPKSVIVIGLPAVQKAVTPPLRPADADHVSCLLKPNVTLPIEGAPLVFSTDFAHNIVLHLNTPPGAPTEPDVPLAPDAYQGGLVLQHEPEHHKQLHDEPVPLKVPSLAQPNAGGDPKSSEPNKPAEPVKPQPQPILLTGTIQGRWGFDPFTGPTVQLQQLPGQDWHIVTPDRAGLIAGHAAQLLLASTGTACVHTITAKPTDSNLDLALEFKPQPNDQPDSPANLAVTLPLDKAARTPGDLHLAIQQYGQPKTDELATRTFAEPAKIASITLHAGDKSVILTGSGIFAIEKLKLGDLVFKPAHRCTLCDDQNETLQLALPDDAPAPATHADDQLTAEITLRDGRVLSQPVTVSTARPAITLLRKTADPAQDPVITLTNPDDLPLTSHLTFTLKSATPFPRNGQIEIETLDGTLRAVLTLAPSGGLLLQDPRTVVAVLDPARSFGSSAFGGLHLRALFPPTASKDTPTDDATLNAEPASDWIPLATLVRLPTITALNCPADAEAPCSLGGANFYLIESVSTDPAFATSTPVPDGYTGSALTIPHPFGSTLFLHLRDDPKPIDSANLPTPPATTPVSHAHAKTQSKVISHGTAGQDRQTPQESGATSQTPATKAAP